MRVLPVLTVSLTGDAPAASASAACDAVLEHEGWVRRSVAEPPRLDEIVALYRELGYDVHLEAIATGALERDCDPCVAGLGAARIVYTRRR